MPTNLPAEEPLYNGMFKMPDGSPLTAEGWYVWRTQSWGTKWNLRHGETYLTENPGELVYDFDTAWSPPEGIVNHLREQYPELEFRLEFAEGGNDFWGIDSEVGSSADVASAPEWIQEYFAPWEEEEVNGSV